MCTALCVLTGAIAVPLLVRPFYWLHIGPLGLEAAAGLTAAEIREANHFPNAVFLPMGIT